MTIEKTTMIRMKTTMIRMLCGLVSLGFFIHCAGFFNGAGAMLVSESDEVKLGTQFNLALSTNDTAKREMPVYVAHTQAQTDAQNYVLGLCQEIIAAVPTKEKPSYPFTCTLIDKDVENAFAVPGGYVYLYTGILKKLKDESELAGVLGHEVTHVTHHHYRRQLAKSTALGLAIQGVLTATEAGQASAIAASAVFQLSALKFSRSDETEADKGGTLITGNMQRNPLGIAKYFSRAKSQDVPEWLSDHPGNRNRVKAVYKIVAGNASFQQLASDSATSNYQNRYQQKIRGL